MTGRTIATFVCLSLPAMSVFAAPPLTPICPSEVDAPIFMPETSDETRSIEFWLDRWGEAADEVSMDREEMRSHNQAWGAHEAVDNEVSLLPVVRGDLLKAAFEERGRMCDRLTGGVCQRFSNDVLAGMGVRSREGGAPHEVGNFVLELEGVSGTEERLRLADAAHERGPVFLVSPLGSFLYLGREPGGRAFGIGALESYERPCEWATDTPVDHRVGRVVVVPLDLSVEGAEKTLLESCTHGVLLASVPGAALEGVVRGRPVKQPNKPRKCKDRGKAAIFFSPLRPSKSQPMHVIATFAADPGLGTLALFNAEGEPQPALIRRLGGPPYSYVATVENPSKGRWTAVFGDGDKVHACSRATVRSRSAIRLKVDPLQAWKPARRWSVATENLFSAFVESLFDYPVDEDLTWPSLQVVLNDPTRNFLYDYRGLKEEKRIHLEPDCADLPYLLRAYFAWKMRLPFGYRQCGYGWNGRAPKCEEVLLTTQFEHGKTDEVKAFQRFSREVIRASRSSGARTAPEDDFTDFYPVALTRESLRPGITYIDPYGHLLVIAKWVPQGTDRYGMLIAADAQPDGTVGRRRFWRGSFLFTPETTNGGAGFKAHRPIVYKRKEEIFGAYTNRELRYTKRFLRHSMEQYEGSAEDFYEKLEGLINPRPLDPIALQLALVDSLEEAVSRRLNSVENGERFMGERAFEPIEMPTGTQIFQTSGPWEDFSTPSRDMRLLIAIDTVVQFAERVRRRPERFGVMDAQEAEELAALTEAALNEALTHRGITYRRSNGQEQRLTLLDLVQRSSLLEMAYNPNDCVEIRWGASVGSEEMKSCRRYAPDEQREKMNTYRPWFSSRQRPTRRQ